MLSPLISIPQYVYHNNLDLITTSVFGSPQMDSSELCDALHVAINKKNGRSVQVSGIIHELQQMSLKLTKEDDGLILDYIHYLRNCNILRWGLNTYSTNSEPPFMNLTKYGEHVFSKDASLIAIKESFLEIYNAK